MLCGQQLSRLGVFFLLATSLNFSHAHAQVPPGTFADLAQAITGNFPLQNTTPTASPDWCYQVEADPNVNWWYLKFDGYLEAHSSYYAKRIRLIYKDNTDSTGATWGFSSIFMGIDLLQSYDGYSTTQELKVEKTEKTKPAVIDLPPRNGCPELQYFLKIAFEGNAQYWTPLGNPLCVDPQDPEDSSKKNCTQYNIGSSTTPVQFWEKQKSQDYGNTNKLLLWNFNGRIHAIPGAMRFLIRFCQPKLPCPDPNATPVYGALIIGYGGSGGAG